MGIVESWRRVRGRLGDASPCGWNLVEGCRPPLVARLTSLTARGRKWIRAGVGVSGCGCECGWECW